ncbi:hypothetical protein A2U01_0018758, partial [Trifolium medium]|nr:hypothetical protein [Trifolium medium]
MGSSTEDVVGGATIGVGHPHHSQTLVLPVVVALVQHSSIACDVCVCGLSAQILDLGFHTHRLERVICLLLLQGLVGSCTRSVLAGSPLPFVIPL